MGLSDIAEGIEVTVEQRDRGVPTVDDTGVDLVARLSAHADALPCTPEAAASVLETHTAGTSIGDSARASGIAPMTAAKALHRCGVVGVSPLTPQAHQIVRDWLDGHLSRSDALGLTGATESEFALGTYVETHDSIPSLAETAESALGLTGDAAVAKRDELRETMSDAGSLRSF